SLSLFNEDAIDFIDRVYEQVDCFYFDPMFEDVKKKSAPKKEMALLREVGSQELNVQRVIKKVREHGTKRIVVKRPINGDYLEERPQISYKGHLIRYDVYTR
ncbi:MAG: class I SAM-dependent methyltransferase, partial [Pseudomonadota bacterium]